MTTVQYLKHDNGAHYDLQKDAIRKPLWFHEKGLMQTATGYGEKLVTEYMVRYKGRMHRVYCHQYSNAGSLYIISKGTRLYIW